jgi:hypothetical protein
VTSPCASAAYTEPATLTAAPTTGAPVSPDVSVSTVPAVMAAGAAATPPGDGAEGELAREHAAQEAASRHAPTTAWQGALLCMGF